MFASDLLVAQLRALGIDHVALNPGATLRGLHESLLQEEGGVRPITTLHEGIAVGIAHGYAKASGRPMGVALHDTVGILNAALAVYNAWADEAPILLLGGVGPLDAGARRPWIDWVHTVSDSPRPIRDSLVWAETPSSLPAALSAIRRAHQRAASTPAGPAWVGLDTQIQESHLSGPIPSVAGPDAPWRVAPDPRAVADATALLAGARAPLLVTDRPLTDAAAGELVRVARRLGARMVELEGAANVPWGHPLDRTPDLGPALAAADVLLLVDVRDAGLVLGRRTAAGGDDEARVIEVGTAALRDASWMISTSDIGAAMAVRLVGDVEAALAGIAAGLGQGDPRADAWPTDPGGDGAAARAAALAAARSGGGTGARVPDDAPLDKATIAAAAAAELPLERLVVAHGALLGQARSALRLQRPSQYLGRSGGEGLGYALPASLGGALAWRGSDRLVVAFLTDGDTMYLPGALWTAAHEGIPLLAIIEDDRGYGRDALHQREVAVERGRDPERSASGVMLREPDIDLAGLARSMGVWSSDRVTSAGDLRRAIAAALPVVAEGAPAVIVAGTR